MSGTKKPAERLLIFMRHCIICEVHIFLTTKLSLFPLRAVELQWVSVIRKIVNLYSFITFKAFWTIETPVHQLPSSAAGKTADSLRTAAMFCCWMPKRSQWDVQILNAHALWSFQESYLLISIKTCLHTCTLGKQKGRQIRLINALSREVKDRQKRKKLKKPIFELYEASRHTLSNLESLFFFSLHS